MTPMKVLYATQMNNHALDLFRTGSNSGAEKCLNKALLACTSRKTATTKEESQKLTVLEKNDEAKKGDCINITFKDEGEYDDEGMRIYCDPLHISTACKEIEIQQIIFFNLGIAYVWLKQYEEALIHFSKSLSLEAICKNLKDDEFNGPNKVAILHNLGYVNFMQERYSEALANFNEALGDLLKLKGYYHRDVANCLNSIGVVTMRNCVENDENGEEAFGFFTETLAIHEAIDSDGPKNEDVSIVMNNIARIKVIRGDLSEALSVFQDVYHIRKSTLGEDHVQTAMSIFNIGETHHLLNDTEAETKMYHKFLKVVSTNLIKVQKTKAYYTEVHVEVAAILNQVGNYFCGRGDLRAAIKAYTLGHDIERVVYNGEDENNSIITIMNVARVHHVENNLHHALHWYEKGLSFQTQSRSVSPMDIARTLTKIGEINDHLQCYAPSIKAYKEAAIIKKCELGSKHSDVASLLNCIGIVYTKAQCYRESIKFYEESLFIHRRLSHVDRMEIVIILYNLGFAYMESDQMTKSLYKFKECLLMEQSCANSAEKVDGIISTLKCIGRVYHSLGENENAMNYYQKAADLSLADCLHANHGDIAQIFGIIGNILLSSGEIKDAMKTFAKAINANR